MRKCKDVAWGFFATGKRGGRFLVEDTSRFKARLWRKHYYSEPHNNPGPIFRITPPKPKRRGGRQTKSPQGISR